MEQTILWPIVALGATIGGWRAWQSDRTTSAVMIGLPVGAVCGLLVVAVYAILVGDIGWQASP